MVNVLALSLYGPLAASHRVRLSHYIDGLSQVGITLHLQSFFDDAYLTRTFSGKRPSIKNLLHAYIKRIRTLLSCHDYHCAIIYGELLPLFPGRLERLFHSLPYIYDFDDSFFLRYRQGRLRLLSPLLSGKFESTIASARLVHAGNHYLYEYASRYSQNVIVLPSVVNTQIFRPNDSSPISLVCEKINIGWIGSPSTAAYLKLILEPLRLLALERPVKLIVIGAKAPDIPGVETVQHPWSLATEVALIQSFHVGVMPLPDTPWTRGKCAYKLIQYMSCGVPVVASPVGANTKLVAAAGNFLANSTHDWLEAFRVLASSPALRSQLGAEARRHVVDNFSLSVTLPVMASSIRNITET
jgi:glycosyltransferase involved in cell wall biosynthesis